MTRFSGFPPAAFDFLEGLAAHNDKAWFEARRDVWEEACLGPLRALVVELGAALQDEAPGLIADPRVGGSIFRIHRDTRFSKDKSPFKTHLGFFLWEGERKATSPGLYIELGPRRMLVGGGLYAFDRDQLAAWRAALADPAAGPAMLEVADALAKAGFALQGEKSVRPAQGFQGLQAAELSRHRGVFSMVWEEEAPKEVGSEALVGWIAGRVAPLWPLHRWLVEHLPA
jgi:uncharacterized protein (TIGR02453 family)